MDGTTGMQYIFEDNCILRIIGNDFSFTDKKGTTFPLTKLTGNTKKILQYLLDESPSKISYDDLYALYGKNPDELYSGTAGALCKMKATMDAQIKPYIKSWSGSINNNGTIVKTKGYHIPDIQSKKELSLVLPTDLREKKSSSDESSIDSEEVPAELCLLSGDYYAFYPGEGKSSILGAYLHITKCENDMSVHAVLDIRHSDDYQKVPHILKNSSDPFSEIDIDEYTEIDWRNLFTGSVHKCSEYVAVITLDSKIDREHWQVVLNLKDFITHPRDYSKDENLYRGGLGIKLGGRTNKIGASRIALIRSSLYIEKYMSLSSQDMLKYLQASNNIYITEQDDCDFYQWLAGKHPSLDK